MKHVYRATLLVLVTCVVVVPGVWAQLVFFVDADATGANDGSTWADAFADLRDALAASTPGDEIWVAEGTYLFALPGSPGACKDAWDEILAPQLDYRHRPCNFVEIMPRLDEHMRRK